MPKSCYCGANNFKTLYAKDVLYGAKNTFEYDVCKKCNSYYLKTKITNNNYDNNYYSLVSKKSHVHIDVLRRLRYRSYLGSIINFFKPVTTYNNFVIKYLKNNHSIPLDFGSGNNKYIHFIKKLNLVDSGYSFDPYAKDLKTIKDYKLIPFSEINLILSNQAFEHVNDPLELLNNLFNSTKGKCDLIFSVPVSGSILNHFQENSYTLQAPDHITILSIEAWKRLISMTDWKLNTMIEDNYSQKFYFKESLKISKNKDVNFKDLMSDQVDNIIFHLKK